MSTTNRPQSGILVSRSSTLARAQVTEFLACWSHLQGQSAAHPVGPASKADSASQFNEELPFLCQFYDSLGDKQKDVSLLSGQAPDDFFTRELDQALLSGEADWALHSAKDLPKVLPSGLKIWALLAPENLVQTDSLVSRQNWDLQSLTHGARLGTSSLSRKQQLLELRPDLEIVSLRGTIEERLARVLGDSGDLDAVIVATCALQRLGRSTGHVLPLLVHPLQGYLAVVGRQQPGRPELQAVAEQLAQLDARRSWGWVVLLGAGAGAAGLLTREGQRIMQEADVIFYDALVGKELLDLAVRAEKIYVGKRRSDHSMSQDEINRQLWQSARQGKKVVRLKGGDALLFARAAEELQALSEALVPYRVLPGISAAFAAAASLSLPLTQRGNDGASLHLLSAYPPEHIDFLHLPPSGNIIFYMGLSQRHEIQCRALAAGRSPEEPVLIVLWASLPQQKNIHTTLAELPQLEFDKKAAGLIMLGPIARHAAKTANAINAPRSQIVDSQNNMVDQANSNTLPELRGKTWITGLNPAMDPDTPPELVWHLPLLELSEPVQDPKELAAELLAALEWASLVLFTSKHAVRYFFAQLDRSTCDLRRLGGKRVVSLGQATTAELEKFGLRLCAPHDWQSPEESSLGLLAEFSRRAQGMAQTGKECGENILIPSSSKALPVLSEGLPLEQNGGHSLKRVVLYDNLMPQALLGDDSPLAFLHSQMNIGAGVSEHFQMQWAKLKQLRAVYLSSPSTVEYFAELVAKPLKQRFGAGFPSCWEYRCKGEPTRRRLAELQAEYCMLGGND